MEDLPLQHLPLGVRRTRRLVWLIPVCYFPRHHSSLSHFTQSPLKCVGLMYKLDVWA